jgi:hypothetical protein
MLEMFNGVLVVEGLKFIDVGFVPRPDPDGKVPVLLLPDRSTQLDPDVYDI